MLGEQLAARDHAEEIAAVEPAVREFTRRCLDPQVGAAGFDLIPGLTAQMPKRTSG